VSERVPEDLRSATRNCRLPLDGFNALLSYGYGLLHTAVMRAVLASGLKPARRRWEEE
jgi:CRISPR-associated protein Cas1